MRSRANTSRERCARRFATTAHFIRQPLGTLAGCPLSCCFLQRQRRPHPLFCCPPLPQRPRPPSLHLVFAPICALRLVAALGLFITQSSPAHLNRRPPPMTPGGVAAQPVSSFCPACAGPSARNSSCKSPPLGPGPGRAERRCRSRGHDGAHCRQPAQTRMLSLRSAESAGDGDREAALQRGAPAHYVGSGRSRVARPPALHCVRYDGYVQAQHVVTSCADNYLRR
jgi:hypothetical protein